MNEDGNKEERCWKDGKLDGPATVEGSNGDQLEFSYKAGVREHLTGKILISFGHCPNYLSPQFGQVVQLFLDVKNDVFARITEPSNDD